MYLSNCLLYLSIWNITGIDKWCSKVNQKSLLQYLPSHLFSKAQLTLTQSLKSKKHGDDLLFLISSHHSHSDNTKLNWSPSSIFTASGLIRQWSSSTWTGTVIFKSLFRQVPTRIVSPTQIHMGSMVCHRWVYLLSHLFFKHYRNVAMSIFCEDGIKLSKLDTARLSSQDNNFETEGTA